VGDDDVNLRLSLLKSSEAEAHVEVVLANVAISLSFLPEVRTDER
jgi:hypothetical protein